MILRATFRAGLFSFFIGLGTVCQVSAQPGSDILRDEVVFKQGVPLPDFAKAGTLKCVVIEQTETQIKVNVSPFKGVQELREISREWIAEIKIGDRSDVALSVLEKTAVLPEKSQSAEYYRRLLDQEFQSFFSVHSQSPAEPAARRLEAAVRKELALVDAGWKRYGTDWYAPEECAALDDRLALESLMQRIDALPKQVQDGSYKELPAIAAEIQKHDRKEYYPDLLEGLRLTLQGAGAGTPPFVKELLKKPIEPMRLAVRHFRESEAKLREMESLDEYPPKTIQSILINLAEAARLFPRMEALAHMLAQRMGFFEQTLLVAAIEMEHRDANFESMSVQLTELVNATELDMAEKAKLVSRVEAVRAYRKRTVKLIGESKLDQFASLQLPEGAGPFAVRRHKEQIEAMARRVQASKEALKKAREHHAQGNFEEAAKEMEIFRTSWRENPDADAVKAEWLADLSNKIKKRDKPAATQTLQLLRGSWAGDPAVEDLGRTLEDHGLLAMLDNMSFALVFAIGFVILLGFFALKWGVKAFSSE